MFAIYNKGNKKWLVGTDYRFFQPRQRTSFTDKLTYNTREEAEADLVKRKCNKYYEVKEI